MQRGAMAYGNSERSKKSLEEESTGVSESSSSCLRRTNQVTSPASFSLSPGRFLHDLGPRDRSLISFAAYVRSMSVFDLFLDYTRVITQDARQTASRFRSFPRLNRFLDIRCVDETRVSVPGPDGHDYIHANYADGFREPKRFILAQAPLRETVERFWALIWQENATVIVSLAVIDGERIPTYIPTKSGASVKFGAIKAVSLGTHQVRDCYDASVLMVTRGEEPARKLVHFLFHDWPDKGTPTRPTEVPNLLEDVEVTRTALIAEAKKKGWLPDVHQPVSPIVVHCVNGVGRTGTFTALDICMRKLDYSANRGTPCVDVRDTVLRLRTQRSLSVQKPEQYVYLHLAMLEFALRRHYFDAVDVVDVSKFLIN